jgi:hypothetical protein
MKYDPHRNPNPEKWQSFGDLQRANLIEEHHSKRGIPLPNPRLHAFIHTIVENQIAMRDEIPVKATLARLMAEGLDRHDAIHAIGSILAVQMHEILTGSSLHMEATQDYFEALTKLTADSWVHSQNE